MRRVAPLLLLLALPACDDGTPALDDGAVTDGGVVDGQAPDALRGPWANVYEHNPTTDQKQTTEVLLQNISEPSGHLTSKYADVWNCLPEPGGKTFNVMGVQGTLCNLRQQAEPGQDGTYLHIKPPADELAGNDSFAEVMMYHHIDTIREHYSSAFGLSHLDKQSIYAVVNLQGNIMGQWMGFPNAGFAPKESPYYLSMLGVSARDAIVFGYNKGLMVDPGMAKANFSYDAAVIYHEYTHYTIGIQVLMALAAPDQHGLSPTPLALNEGLSDYFPSSFLEDPVMGVYSLGNQQRDLTEDLRCPTDLHGESHIDGRIASGALWAARAIVGPEVLDRAVWNAVLTFNADTTFEEAAVAILDEVKQAAPTKHDAVKALFEERGFLGCLRLAEHKDFTANPLDPTTSVGYPGSQGILATYADGLPAYIQYRVAVQDTTQELTIEYRPEVQTGLAVTKGDVWVALKPGGAPILYDYSSGAGKHDAHVVLKGDDAGNMYKLVLSGDCIAKGDLVFQFINKAVSSGELTQVKVTQSATKTNAADNFIGCTP